MYYNEEAKVKFIKDYMRSRIVARTSLTAIFNKTAPFEQKYKKDCSQFTQAEILDMYKKFEAKSTRVLENYNVYLKHYTAYRLFHRHIVGNNPYDMLNKDMIKACMSAEIQKQIYITREQLDDIENELFNYTDKAIVEALWQGISGKSMCDLVALNREMFSEDKQSLIFPDGRIVPISRKLSEYLDKAFDETEYMCYGNTIKVEKLNGYGQLYKERFNVHASPSDDTRFRWCYRKFQNFRKQFDMPAITMKNVQASGLLYYIKQGMQQNDCSMREFLYTEQGKALALQYGYKQKHYVDVIHDKFKELEG